MAPESHFRHLMIASSEMELMGHTPCLNGFLTKDISF